jgi:hypothetical protein
MTEPKDYQLARRAYEAFHEEQPQVWFEDLSQEYQMRWVRAIRATIGEYRTKSFQGRPPKVSYKRYSKEADEKLVNSAPRRPSGQVDHSQLTAEESNAVKAAMQRIQHRERTLLRRSK